MLKNSINNDGNNVGCKSNHTTTVRFRIALEKAVKLSEDPINETLIGRHLKVLDEILKNAPLGVWVRDLSYVIRLVESLYERCVQCYQYREHFFRILDICFFTPVLRKTSEVLEFETDIKEFLSMFGDILARTTNYSKFCKVCRGLGRMLNRVNVPICCLNKRVLNAMLAESQTPVIVAELLHIASYEFYLLLIDLTANLLQNENTCRVLILHKVMNTLVQRLNNYAGYTNKFTSSNINSEIVPKHFYQTLNIIFRLTEVYGLSSKQFQEQVGLVITYDAWDATRGLFQQLVLSRRHKSERNALMRCYCTSVRIIPVEQHAGFQLDILTFGLATEVGTAATWAAQVLFSGDDEDFEFKYIMLSFFCFYRGYPLESGALESRNLLIGLLRLLMPEVKLIWTKSQRFKLMKYALISLECVIEYLIPEFLNYAGPARLLRVLESTMQGDLPINLQIPCLICIHTTLKISTPLAADIAKKYRAKAAINTLLSNAKKTTGKGILTLDDQRSLKIIFCILQRLNKNYECAKEEAIDICLACIQRYLHPNTNDCFLCPKVIVAVLDFLWENITLSQSNYKVFLSSGGVYVLLDIIEIFPIAIKLIALSILVDLTEDGSSLPFISTWRGRNGLTALSLFMNVFRVYNDGEGTVTEQGTIKDLFLPLMGAKQMELTFRRRKNPNSSPSSLNMLGNPRPKIYALLHLMQCSRRTQLIYSHYSVRATQLTKDDEIALVLAENYLPLKVCETWIELSYDLNTAGIRPLSFDDYLISSKIIYGYRLSDLVRDIQNDVLDEQQKQYIVEERALYQRLNDQILSEVLESLSELNMQARCIEPIYRVLRKNKQKPQIFSFRKFRDNLSTFHETFLYDLDVTSVFQQNVSIRSNVVEDPHQSEILSILSSESSGSNNKKIDAGDNSASQSACSDSLKEFTLLTP